MNKFLLGFFGLLLLVSSVGAVEVNASNEVNASALVNATVGVTQQVGAASDNLQTQIVTGVLKFVNVTPKRIDLTVLLLGITVILIGFKAELVRELLTKGKWVVIVLGFITLLYGIGVI